MGAGARPARARGMLSETMRLVGKEQDWGHSASSGFGPVCGAGGSLIFVASSRVQYTSSERRIGYHLWWTRKEADDVQGIRDY
jgi:hypothetical protein